MPVAPCAEGCPPSLLRHAVTVLNMYDNNLVRFGSLAPLTALKELRLYGNNLEEAPTLAEHKSLIIIELQKNRIATIPDDYFDATPALQRLSVWSNMLTTLPPSVCRCSALVGLSAQENKMASLPGGAPWPATLETLFLQQNPPLTTLPAELGACSALKRVNLSELKLDGAGLEVAEKYVAPARASTFESERAWRNMLHWQ